MSNLVIRQVGSGEVSLVSHFYYKIFETQFDFLPSTEQYFLHACEELFDNPEKNKMWIIENGGKIKGSICVIDRGEHDAQLRLFGMDASLQGKGAGKALMQTAMDYCKKMQYTHVSLWTIDICKAARHLYAKFDFKLTDTKENNTWANYSITEELWEFNDD